MRIVNGCIKCLFFFNALLNIVERISYPDNNVQLCPRPLLIPIMCIDNTQIRVNVLNHASVILSTPLVMTKPFILNWPLLNAAAATTTYL